MGGKETKPVADINSNGQINDNVIVQEYVEIWKGSRTLLFVLVVLKICQILYVIYLDYRHGIKKNAIRNDRSHLA